MNAAVGLAIVDDHRVFREGLVSLLGSRAEIDVVGDFADAEAFLAAIENTVSPDVVLLDLHLPGAGGLATTARMRTDRPDLRVLVLTMNDDPATVRAAVDAGAHGYLVKTSGLDDIARAVLSVHAGQFVLGAGVDPGRAATARRDARSIFTDREQQVLDMLASGSTTGQIAERLGISGKTVRNYLSTLYAKLGVEDRGQAALAARHLRDGD